LVEVFFCFAYFCGIYQLSFVSHKNLSFTPLIITSHHSTLRSLRGKEKETPFQKISNAFSYVSKAAQATAPVTLASTALKRAGSAGGNLAIFSYVLVVASCVQLIVGFIVSILNDVAKRQKDKNKKKKIQQAMQVFNIIVFAVSSVSTVFNGLVTNLVIPGS
jgi:hypothetical protein